jgi:Arc/MetJ-type ribon-helix-helix transcriptional regulator
MPYTVSPEIEQMIEAKRAAGGYATADELLMDALTALDELKSRHHELRDSIRSRLTSADRALSQPLDIEAFKAEVRQA